MGIRLFVWRSTQGWMFWTDQPQLLACRVSRIEERTSFQAPLKRLIISRSRARSSEDAAEALGDSLINACSIYSMLRSDVLSFGALQDVWFPTPMCLIGGLPR